MARLIVTFSRIDSSKVYDPPVAKGSDIRTEILTMPGTTTMAAEAGEEIVELLADADCWVGIGSAPSSDISTDGTGASARFLKANVPYTFSVSEGDKVAAEAD